MNILETKATEIKITFFGQKKRRNTFIITNLKERIKDLDDSFFDSDFVCERLAGILSCISCTIYNKKKLGIIKLSNTLFGE